MTVMAVVDACWLRRAILPDGPWALKLSAMAILERLREAWQCEACRFYRRAALALGLLAAGAWLLL